jgi:mannose-1-phosphate guanylyltransferase
MANSSTATHSAGARRSRDECDRTPWTAVILAGGPGTRARAIDPGMPKPLLPIGGAPAVLRQARWLARCAANPPQEIMIATGHDANRVEAVIPPRIATVPLKVVRTAPQGTVAALHSALTIVETDRVLALNCDTLVGCTLDRLLACWPRAPHAMTLLCSENENTPNRGEVLAEGGRLLRMRDPAQRPAEDGALANTGVYLFSRGRVTRFLDRTPTGARIERQLANRVAAMGLANVHRLGDVAVIDFGTPRGWESVRHANPNAFEILTEVTL